MCGVRYHPVAELPFHSCQTGERPGPSALLSLNFEQMMSVNTLVGFELGPS